MDDAKNESGGGYGFFLGIVVLVGFLAFLFFYGLPFVTKSLQQTPAVQIPDSIDVNVTVPKEE